MSWGRSSRLKVIISGDERDAKRAFESVRRQAKETDSSLKRSSAESKKAWKEMGNHGKSAAGGLGLGSLGGLAAGGGIAAAGVASIAIAGDAIAAYDKEQESVVRLDNALKNAKLDTDANKRAAEEAGKAGVHYGTNVDETNNLIAEGITAGKSMAMTLKLLQDAQDLAAQSGHPLAETMLDMIKFSNGATKSLKKYGIDLPIAAGGALSLEKAQAKLATAEQHLADVRDKGAASSAAKSQRADEKVRKAQQALADLEARQHARGRLRVVDEQALARAHMRVTDALNERARVSTRSNDAEAKALQAVKDAQKGVTDAKSSGAKIVGSVEKRVNGAGAAEAQTTAGRIREAKAQIEELKVALGEHITTFLGNDVIPALKGIGQFELNFGHGFQLEVIDPLVRAWQEADHLGQSLATALGLSSGAHDDTAAIYARNDAKMGWSPGTTKQRVEGRGVGSANFVGPLTPAEQERKNANDLAAAGSYARAKQPHPGDANFVGPLTPAERASHSTTIIHVHGTQSAAKTNADITRHDKRNGRPTNRQFYKR